MREWVKNNLGNIITTVIVVCFFGGVGFLCTQEQYNRRTTLVNATVVDKFLEIDYDETRFWIIAKLDSGPTVKVECYNKISYGSAQVGHPIELEHNIGGLTGRVSYDCQGRPDL